MLHDLIVYTDIGDDIDDSLALWYLYKKNHIRNFIIVLYSCEAEKRNHAWELIEPFFEKRPIIVQGHNTSMIEHFLETRKRDIPLDIFCIGPTTDLAHHITNIPQYQKSINKIIFQARLKYDGGVFIPDSDSYNYKQDIDAASVIVALHIPLFRIGKYTAYQIGLTEKHFKKRGKSGIGKILYKEGLHWKMNFAMINPAKYQQVYGHYPHVISFPYDLIAAVAMYHPQYFQRVHQEQHSCCGHDVEHCFKVDKSVIYSEIDSMFI